MGSFRRALDSSNPQADGGVAAQWSMGAATHVVIVRHLLRRDEQAQSAHTAPCCTRKPCKLQRRPTARSDGVCAGWECWQLPHRSRSFGSRYRAASWRARVLTLTLFSEGMPGNSAVNKSSSWRMDVFATTVIA